MFPHHAETIQNVKDHFSSDPHVLALLLSGSIAHGFETADSDVDVLIVLTEDEFAKRVQTGQLTFVSTELSTYPGGYIDAKYLSLSFIRQVAEKGSEPARFAFDGAQILFSHIEGLEEEIQRAVAYPVAGKSERIMRFRTQLEAWRWFCGEGRKKGNEYLLGLAARKLVLFGGRLILTHNEMLYPFHKWFLKVLQSAPEKPDGMIACIDKLLADPSEQNVEEFYVMVKNFQTWEENPNRWGAQFMVDNELTWMTGYPAVDDL
ncbi:hypothetical protein MFIFM68171_01718 [Madurella fahalii]|uniref:Polymerase nucleotidyl transferase domain-containing protein n=1 Tax=Madurella fahalii TaxID=1157608 RepID=A0ABQ0G180_9PEZI